jgi:hypothetical protein
MILFAIALSAAAATDALAAGHGGRGEGEFRSGDMVGGFGRQLLNSVPSMPPPIFNPSRLYSN